MATLFNRKWNQFYARQRLGALETSDRLNILIETGRDAFGMEVGMISRIVDTCFTVEYSTQCDYLEMRLPLYHTYCDITIKLNDVLATHDISRLPFTCAGDENPLNVQSYIGIPLWVNDNLYGTMSFIASEPQQRIFTERDKNFIRGIARSAQVILS